MIELPIRTRDRERRERRESGDIRIKLAVKVVPGAARDRIAGWLGDSLKIAVRAPAERGKANRAVVEILCAALGAEVYLVEGVRSPHKVVELAELTADQVRERIAQAMRTVTRR